MSSHDRAFRGVWIPAGLWMTKELSIQEKLMLVEIDSLQHPERGCFKSNRKMAEFFGLSAPRISAIVASLAKKGFVRVEQIRDGKLTVERRIFMERSIQEVFGGQDTKGGWSGSNDNPSQDAEGGWSGSNEERGSGLGVKGEGENPPVASDDATCAYPDAFEQCWKGYPKRHRSDNKKSAFKKWQARINEGVQAEILAKSVKRYADECEQEGIQGTRYVKLAATFFGPDEHWREYAGTAKVHKLDEHRNRVAQQDVEIKRAPSRGRPIPSECNQPDDDGILTLPDGRQCHIDEWDAGTVTWGNQA